MAGCRCMYLVFEDIDIKGATEGPIDQRVGEAIALSLSSLSLAAKAAPGSKSQSFFSGQLFLFAHPRSESQSA